MTPTERLRAVVDELIDGVDELVAEQKRRTDAEAPAWRLEYPEIVATAADVSRESFLAELRALRDGGRLPSECPPTERGFARLAGALGWPIHEGVLVYQRAHAILWEAWFAGVERLVFPPEDRAELLLRGSRFFFAYSDRLLRLMSVEYMEERERALRSREQRRVHLVRELLDGVEVDAAGLDYPLEGWHVGVVAWGEAAEETLRAAARQLDRRLLVVQVADDTWWAWLGGLRPLGREPQPVVTPGTNLALGREEEGREGFRTTHEQALEACRVAARRGGPVTQFGAVALEALGARDPTAARTFVKMELRSLDGDDARSAALRETLRAWFRSGHNAAAAAAALGVHEQTVAARLRAVEDRIGQPPADRRAELETALRLRDAL